VGLEVMPALGVLVAGQAIVVSRRDRLPEITT
jgi:hypothetical protein